MNDIICIVPRLRWSNWLSSCCCSSLPDDLTSPHFARRAAKLLTIGRRVICEGSVFDPLLTADELRSLHCICQVLAAGHWLVCELLQTRRDVFSSAWSCCCHSRQNSCFSSRRLKTALRDMNASLHIPPLDGWILQSGVSMLVLLVSSIKQELMAVC